MGVRQAALAVVAVVVAAANNGVEAARYEDNLLTEFTFSQAECKSRAFADSVTEDYLGGLTYPSGWATLEKCPTYTDADDTVFEYAYNGMHSVGARYLASGSGTNLTLDDSAKSTSSAASLLSQLDGVTDFTLEFWIVPGDEITGSSSNLFVLFEIGDEKDFSTVGESYTWTCGTATDFSLQLLYNRFEERFELTYRRAATACTTLEFDSTPLVAGKLYHVLLIGSYNSGSDIFTANLQVHAQDESIDSSNNQVTSNEITFSNFDSAHVLRLGSSPATLSGDIASTGLINSFPGDILHFSFYNESLGTTEIADNFAAKTLNSGPVPANDVVRQTFSEDDYTAVDLTKAVFDFDDVFFSTESMTYTLTSSTNGDFLGNTFRYNSNVVTPSTSINPAVADLEWRNAITDDWGWSNTTFFTVTGSDGSMTSAAATLSPEAVGTNDAPEQTVGTETAAHTPQAGAQLLTFSVTDADCATRGVQYSDGALDTQDETLLDNSCTNLGGISNVTILAPADAVKLGVLFYPNNLLECTPYDSSTMTEITVDTTFTESDEEWNEVSDGVVEVSLCFEACLSYAGSENPCPAGVDGGASAILGNSTFQFYGTDQITDGPTGTVTTTVTNVLTMTEQTNLITYEETALEITLSGSDEFCERFNSSLCPRAKSFLIDSLPLASEGIFYLDEELTTPLVEGEMYAGADSATLKVYLMPGKDYFSANEWPICGPAISTESNPVSAWSFSFCINEDDGIDTFPCEGPLCNGWYNTMPAAFGDALTTADLEGNAMGGCGADVSVGCPVELMVSLVVGNLTSEPLAGASVHVINVNDEPEIIIPAANLSDVVRAVDTPVSWTDANGDPTYIYISDSDGDVRVMDLVLSTPSSGQLSFQDVNRSLPTLRFSVNQASSSQGDTLIGLTGTVTSLNYALQHLHYIVPAARREDTVTLYVLDESRDIGPASFNVDDLNEESVYGSGYVVDTELEVYFDNAVDTQSFAVGAVVLWASIIGATLLCCGCVYSVVHAVVRRALMGERAAMWIVRNVFFTHITDAKDEDLSPEARRLSRIAMTRIHAEEVTMTRVFCCLHLLACLCPCCIKFKGDKTMLPTKDAMLAATVSDLSHGMAKKHLPGDVAPRITELTTREAMEYEEHEVVTNDGRVRKYLFNPHTGRSLWMANVRIVHSAHGPNSSSDDSD